MPRSPRQPQPAPSPSVLDSESEGAERRLAGLPTKTVLTALGGVAVATGWASTAEAMPAYDHAPPKTAPTSDPGTANSAEGPQRATPKPRAATPPPAQEASARKVRPAADPGTSTNAEPPKPARDVGTANSAEGPPPGVSRRQLQEDPGTSTNAEPPKPAQKKPAARKVPDPDTSTNAEPARDVGTANSAEGPPPGVSRRQLQEDPGTSTNAEPPKPARKKPAARKVPDPGTSTNAEPPTTPVRDPGTSTNAEPARDVGTANSAEGPPPGVSRRQLQEDPGTSTNAEPPRPARDVGTANSAEGPPPGVSRRQLQEDPGTANSAEGPPPGVSTRQLQEDPGTANSAEGPVPARTLGRRPARAPRGGHPSVPPPLTPEQRAAAQNYVNTLDHINADGGALRPGTAAQLRRFGADPRAVAEAHRIIAARDASKKRLDNGGVEADPDPGGYQLTESGFDDKSRQKTRAVQRTNPRVGLPGITNDHNRETKPLPSDPVKGVPGAQGYGWNDGDDDVDYWTPQGLGGQNGEQITSWYREGKDGKSGDVRVGFTSPDQKGYRFALAVRPKADGTYDRTDMHAGGSAQYGNYVYMPDTKNGLRVYDTRDISEVPENRRDESDNYKYLLPEVGSYKNTGRDLLYSTVSVDRSNPKKPALVVGEYRNDDDDKTKGDTHVVRWDIDPNTGRLSQSKASAAYVTKRDQVQGAAMDHGNIYLSSSESDTGRLYHGKPGGTIHDSPWSSSPESLYVDRGRLWSLSEHAGERSVFSVPLPH